MPNRLPRFQGSSVPYAETVKKQLRETSQQWLYFLVPLPFISRDVLLLREESFWRFWAEEWQILQHLKCPLSHAPAEKATDLLLFLKYSKYIPNLGLLNFPHKGQGPHVFHLLHCLQKLLTNLLKSVWIDESVNKWGSCALCVDQRKFLTTMGDPFHVSNALPPN